MTTTATTTAVITHDSGRGYFWAESCDSSHLSIFCHQNQVIDGRRLHVGDHIECKVVPNDRKPGHTQAVDIRYIGQCIARQVGDNGGAL